MEALKSIVLIGCYFGKLPWYFEYFVHSCRFNTTIDFVIITDDKSYTKSLPENILLVNMTLRQINLLASSKLNTNANIQYGYKMCDFKPAYGVIFDEFLVGYDYWGHIDIDVIFGDIREFITPEVLEKYKLISVRPDWLTGCFLLYKNCLRLNTLYTNSKDYKKVFSSAEHYCFDETNFSHGEFSIGYQFFEIKTEVESMMHVVKKLEGQLLLKPYFDLHIIEGKPGMLKWQKGKMFYRDQYEILLYHLIEFKRSYHENIVRRKLPSKFRISSNKIYRFK